MDLRLDREPNAVIPGRADGELAAFGRIYINNAYFCRTLEDQVREEPFKPVADWKIPKLTAVPSGMYQLAFRDSPHFGPFTLWVQSVPGFDFIEIHGGTTVDDSDGCIMVGDTVDKMMMTISGAKWHHVLDDLKAQVRNAIARKENVRLQIRNDPAWYAAHGLPVTKAFA